jgi:ketosteroid isomerase-like protein
MADERQDFERFLRRREEAAKAYVSGDPEPLREIATRTSPATFFSPQGDRQEGAEQVWTTYEQGAGAFAPGGETHFEILDLAASGEVAYWTGVQHAVVNVGAGGEATPMDLRVTEAFRRENGDWKLVHRHASPLRS